MVPSPGHLKVWKVFVASPSDVLAEREQLSEIVRELNEGVAHLQDIHIELKDWSEVIPLMGRPQQGILDQLELKDTDLVIVILWHRFGTPPGGIHPRTGRTFWSGTEEEFTLAYDLWKEHGRPQICVYRCLRDISPKHTDGEQLARLQAFLEGFKANGQYPGLVQDYRTEEDFRRRVHRDLVKLLHRIGSSEPDESAVSPVEHIPPSDPKPADDTVTTQATFEDIDSELLEPYLKGCGKEQYLEPSPQEHEKGIRKYLCQLRLLSRDGRHLTRAGALLLCQEGRMPAGSCTDVLIFDQRSEPGTPPRFGVGPPVYRVFLEVKDYLEGALLTGEEQAEHIPYPSQAIVEALANFLIHRDYDSPEVARIEITDGHIRFVNPGYSLIDMHDLKAARRREESLHPPRSKLRNPGLVRALREARIGQKQGRGLIRIKQALARKSSRTPGCDLVLDLESNTKQNRFTLVIYRKLANPSPEETRIIELTSQKEQLEDETEQLQDQLEEQSAALQEVRENLQQTHSRLDEGKRALEEASTAISEQNISLGTARKTQRLYLALLLFSLVLLGALGLGSMFSRGASASPLQVELGVAEDFPPHCNPYLQTWSATLYIRSEGGQPPLTYYWNSQEIVHDLSVQESDVTFSLQERNGKAIEGTAFAVSADGQSSAREIRIEAPLCP